MDKILAFIPTLLSLLGKAQQFPAIITAIEGVIASIKALLPTQETPKYNVTWLQTTLKTLGFDPGAIDGKYGDLTKAAVAAYQTSRGLFVDGWAGVNTTAKLIAEKK